MPSLTLYDLSGAGHQLANSYYAMSNGGWFGLGLGNSIEKQGYLPEAHTDFVFAIVIEGLGFVGASLILALLFFLNSSGHFSRYSSKESF